MIRLRNAARPTAARVSGRLPDRGIASAVAPIDVALERALEGLFRLGANRRFNQSQADAVGAVVTRAGYSALRSLYDQGPLSVRRIAEACAMDAATASRSLPALVDDGLVERRSVAGDARQVELALTRRGRAVYERIVDYRLDQLTSVLAGWSQADRAKLVQLATRLSSDLAGLPRGDEAESAGPSMRARSIPRSLPRAKREAKPASRPASRPGSKPGSKSRSKPVRSGRIP